MVLGQPLGGNDHCSAALLPPMTGRLKAGHRMVLFHLAEAGPGVGQERLLVGLQRQAPVAALRVDRRNRAAIAVHSPLSLGVANVAVAHRGAIGSSPMGDGPSDDGDGATWLIVGGRDLSLQGDQPEDFRSGL